MKQLERELNDMLAILLNSLFSGLWYLIRCTFKGAARMRGLQVAGFGVSLFGAYMVLQGREQYDLLLAPLEAPARVMVSGYAILLLLPVWYLFILGCVQEMRQKEIRQQFEAVGFKARDGRPPYLVKKTKDKKGLKKSKKYKEVYIFKSNIPLSDWLDARERIETAIDRNIIRFSEGRSKKVCHITTVPAGCMIPEMVRWSDEKLSKKEGVMVLGETALETIEFDLNRTPHVLAAGETGSGKSVVLRLFLWQFICRGARVFMFDFKGGVEFGKRYEAFGEVVTDRKRAIEVLTELYEENDKRLRLFRELEVKNLPEYNRKTGQNLCRIGAFCDEIAEMMDKTGLGKEDRAEVAKIEGLVSSLARLSRATGINLILGMQRPDAKVLTGQIKNNIPIRICGRFADRAASEIVLGNTDAVYLPDTKGRFLFRLGNITEQVQAYLFDDDLHLHGDVPEVGQMLLEMDADSLEVQMQPGTKKEPDQQKKPGRPAAGKPGFVKRRRDEAQTVERNIKKVTEKETRKDEVAMAKAAKKLEKSSEKLADKQEEFSFTWSCEGKDDDE